MSKKTDDEINEFLELVKMSGDGFTISPVLVAAMLRQLRDERKAVLKDLKALEADVKDLRDNVGMSLERWLGIVDLTRSEKYDTETPD